MRSIAALDWAALAAAGFRGCVFDKDNTLTVPYAREVAPGLAPALARCRAAFGGRVVLFSNSAGLAQFDPEGARPAEALSAAARPALCCGGAGARRLTGELRCARQGSRGAGGGAGHPGAAARGEEAGRLRR